jgi:hypothetical protein
MIKSFILILTLSIFKQCPDIFGTKNDVTRYIKLDMTPPILIGCGGFRIAYGFMYKDEKDIPIVCIVRCPFEYGEHFFNKDSIYEVKLSSLNINDSLKGYEVYNSWENDTIPTFLICNIKKARAK